MTQRAISEGEGSFSPSPAADRAKRGFVAGFLETGAIGTAFLMPLAFWSPAESPFSGAKQWLLLTWVLAGFAAALAGGIPEPRRIPARALYGPAAWLCTLALSAGLGIEVSFGALLLAMLPCGSFLLLLWIVPDRRRLILALITSGTLVACVAVLQYLQLDPFRLIGLAGSSEGFSRMRVFSTLGNPNFVAAFLAALLPLTVACGSADGFCGRVGSYLFWASAWIQAAAIVATGSRAPILALAAAGAWLWFRRSRSRFRFVAAGLTVAAILLAFSPARPLERTLAGRFHIWKIVCLHIMEIPVTGYGPGAFPLRFALWETDYWRLHPEGSDPSFAGLQDHAHNDYLEIIVNHGATGLAAFAFMLALLVPARYRKRMTSRRLEDGMIASIIALLTVAVVDFPLHRPAELYLFWTLVALLWISDGIPGRVSSESAGSAKQR